MSSTRSIITVLSGLTMLAQVAIAQEIGPQETAAIQSNHTSSSESTQSILQYQNQIAEQEKLGHYDTQLSEQLLGLGLLYKTEGQYEKASEVLERSLHINRVNKGIQSMAQIPILEALIESNTASRRWDALNQNYHLLLWVHQRNFEPGDPAMLPIIEAFGRWKLKAYANRLLSERPSTTLNDLFNMYKSTINVMENLYGEYDPRLVVPLNGQAIVNYLLVQEALKASIDEFQGVGRRSFTRTVCRFVKMPDGSMQQICTTEEVPNPDYYISKQRDKDRTVATRMNSVRGPLNRIVKIYTSNPSLSSFDHATALINLGDWYLLNNRRGTAMKNYKLAYQILENDKSDPDNINKLFGKPRRVPSMIVGSPDNDEDIDRELERPFVKLTFDVAVNGKARNIKVIEESDPNNTRARRLAKQHIRSSLFRPRLQDGEPVATQQTILQLSGAILERELEMSLVSDGTKVPGSRILR